MTPQKVNQITAVVALLLFAILFVLVSQGVINGLVAILLTLAIGAGVQFIRKSRGSI